MTGTTATGTTTAAEQLARMADGYLTTQLLYVAAVLGVADALADGPRTAAELADRVDADPGVLHRLLRGLAAEEVLDEQADGQFTLTAVGQVLRADVPLSQRGVVLARGGLYYGALVGLLDAARRGGTPFEIVHGAPFFDYLATRPDEAAAFQASMSARLAREAAAVVAAHDFRRYRSLVDVGGGEGSLLAAILDAAPNLAGTLFDRPEVVEKAWLLAVAGDFFVKVPPGADAYLLSRVIHDWDDEDAVAILRTCRRAMPDDGRLLLIEALSPDRAVEHPTAVRFDLHMLTLVRGRERTEAEYAALLDAAGLRLDQVVPVIPTTGLHLLEAHPA